MKSRAKKSPREVGASEGMVQTEGTEMNGKTGNTGASRLASSPESRAAFAEAVDTAYDVSAMLDLIKRVDELAEGIRSDQIDTLTCSIARVAALANGMMGNIIDAMEITEIRGAV